MQRPREPLFSPCSHYEIVNLNSIGSFLWNPSLMSSCIRQHRPPEHLDHTALCGLVYFIEFVGWFTRLAKSWRNILRLHSEYSCLFVYSPVISFQWTFLWMLPVYLDGLIMKNRSLENTMVRPVNHMLSRSSQFDGTNLPPGKCFTVYANALQLGSSS